MIRYVARRVLLFLAAIASALSTSSAVGSVPVIDPAPAQVVTLADPYTSCGCPSVAAGPAQAHPPSEPPVDPAADNPPGSTPGGSPVVIQPQPADPAPPRAVSSGPQASTGS